MSKKDELRYAEEVVIPWGFTEVRGRVAEVYGPPQQRRVVVALEPEMSSYVVDEPTTVAVPLADVRRSRRRTSADRTDEVLPIVDTDRPRTAGRRVPGMTTESSGTGEIRGAASNQWLDVAGAAVYLRTSTSFVRKLVLERRVRHYKVGSLLRFDRDDLETFVRGGLVEPTPDPSGPPGAPRR